jgi:tetratricopeptide (TPR) repeat protein
MALLLAACQTAGPRSANAPDDAASDAAVQPEDAADREVMSAIMAGEFAWQDGRAEIAAGHFARAARVSRDPKVAAHATRVAIAAAQWDLAREMQARWAELDGKDLAITQAGAMIAIGTGDTERAWPILRGLLKAPGGEGRRLVGQALRSSGRPETALELLRRFAAEPDSVAGLETLLTFSQVAQQLGDLELALQFAQLASAQHAEQARAWLWLGHAHLRLEDRAAAEQAFARAVAIDPADKSVRLTLAAALSEAGDHAAAARALRGLDADDEVYTAQAAYAARAEDRALMREVHDALAAMPEPRPDARVELLGQLAELIEHHDAALRWYREVPRGDRYVDAQMRIAVLLDRKGALADSRAHLAALRAEGIDDDDKLAETFLLEAELVSNAGDGASAVDVYSAGLAALPDHRQLLYGRALAYEALDRIDECEADLRRLLALDPDDPDTLNALGYTLADRTDRFDEAHELISRALEQKPDEPAIIDSMGWVEYRRGNLDAALKHLQRAFELDRNAEIGAHLGEVLWKLGRQQEARRAWDAAAEADSDNEVLLETRRRLDP